MGALKAEELMSHCFRKNTAEVLGYMNTLNVVCFQRIHTVKTGAFYQKRSKATEFRHLHLKLRKEAMLNDL